MRRNWKAMTAAVFVLAVLGSMVTLLFGAADTTGYDTSNATIGSSTWFMVTDDRPLYFGNDSDVALQWNGTAGTWTIVPAADGGILDFGSTSYGFKIRQRKSTDEFATSGTIRGSTSAGTQWSMSAAGALSPTALIFTGTGDVFETSGTIAGGNGAVRDWYIESDGTFRSTATDSRTSGLATSTASGTNFLAGSTGVTVGVGGTAMLGISAGTVDVAAGATTGTVYVTGFVGTDVVVLTLTESFGTTASAALTYAKRETGAFDVVCNAAPNPYQAITYTYVVVRK